MMKRSQAGFTLIEIAIVLVIISLLLGGALKGQELINSAKVKNLATDFKNIPVFIYGYQDKFKALPGDDAAASSHVTASINGDANGVIDGKWNDVIADDTEAFNFWQHARLAGLAPGPTDKTDADYIPRNASLGKIGVQSGSATAPPIKDKSGNPIRGAYIICSDGVLGKFVRQLDTVMDDGNIGTGSMLAEKTYSFGGTADDPTVAATAIDEAAGYTVCMGV
jgi:prepilin-type N-terminal cleavage/methylation domain-containing protein